MASSKVISRLSSRLQPLALKLGKRSLAPELSPLNSCSQSHTSVSVRRISRLPVELSSLETMMPLHSAIASARLTSSLSVESKSWSLVPQGISMPL
ncbi:uncharacterized protein LOC121251185 [Juglans microcarpa x Juglans regia]|uniref:uncharacterized protein LOC121251185 n=1 Tax=Juglans microcarpa x Juglans regia TaxID=2249226 RepID=UPI001B7E4EE8|nr:uncharacterized protein LOC121251185 [Juglans microcarpa x Juglans regia]